ncbi:alpha/beta hydrolase [Chachezhania antarctica]|uniref:alpha/beta hydrolase n=1 Tax=Chachezhania antarctica TaxID=2340860 RepID=UPI000EACE520|nr:alpha/beta hydrolase [Chachezhania antarctica]
MSWQARLLNPVLRYIEKPQLARAVEPAAVRAKFERHASWLFRRPRGVAIREAPLGEGQALWCGAGEGTILYVHGGAYIMGSPRTHAYLAARIAQATGATVCVPRYRLAPEHPFPAAPDDIMAAYRALLEAGHDPRRVIIGGDSAGGGLALVLLTQILAKGLPVPAGYFGFSPFTDLTFSGASFRENAKAEVLLPATRAEDLAEFYLQGQDPADLRASPLFADMAGAPPVWLSVSDTEILRDDTFRLAEKLAEQGREVHLHKAGNLPHAWPIFQGRLPEADVAIRDLAVWVRSILTASAGS